MNRTTNRRLKFLKFYPIVVAIIVAGGIVVAGPALAVVLRQTPGLLELSTHLDEIVGLLEHRFSNKS
jgi:hypothetical protein